MRELLRIEGLTAGYGGVPVIRDVRLALRPGEVLGIVGESGSGKSTLLKSVAQVRGLAAEIIAGSVHFAEHDMAMVSAADKRRLHGEELAMVFQYAGASLSPARTIGAQLVEA